MRITQRGVIKENHYGEELFFIDGYNVYRKC